VRHFSFSALPKMEKYRSASPSKENWIPNNKFILLHSLKFLCECIFLKYFVEICCKKTLYVVEWSQWSEKPLLNYSLIGGSFYGEKISLRHS